MLLLETGMIGVFVSLDLFLFYVFWEVMLIPMYFIIGVWGGARRIYAAVKFVLYTMVGLAAHAGRHPGLYFQHGAPPGSTRSTCRRWPAGCCRRGRAQNSMFLAFALAFAIKVPLFPFHTWLPDAHVEAPTAGSVILAGVLLKMGTYGFLRFACRSSPTRASTSAPLVFALAVIGIVYGAWVSHGAARPQEAGRVFVRVPPGLRDAGPLHAQPRRAWSAGHPDDQPRPLDRARSSCWSA